MGNSKKKKTCFFNWLPLNSLRCFTAEILRFPRVSPGDQPPAKENEDSGYEIVSSREDIPEFDL